MAEHYYQVDDYYMQSKFKLDKFIGRLRSKLNLPEYVTDISMNALNKYLETDLKRDDRIAVDLTFSAPKSVSLALASSEEIREELLLAHHQAVNRIMKVIEREYIQTRIKGRKVNTGNMIADTHNHFTSRELDLQLHTHCKINNVTLVNGELYSIDYGKIFEYKTELGLMYRAQLAQNLQKMGFELEVTDYKNGFFELKGWDKELLEEYSKRRLQIEAYMEQTGKHSPQGAQEACLATRKVKDHQQNLEEIINSVHDQIFDNNQQKIIRRYNKYEHQKERNNISDLIKRNDATGGKAFNYSNAGTLSKEKTVYAFTAASSNERFNTSIPTGLPVLPDLQQSPMAKGTDRTDAILPPPAVDNMAKHGAPKECLCDMRGVAETTRSERCLTAAHRAIEELSQMKFAFSIPELRIRIMSSGVLENISPREAEKLIEEAGLIKLGHKTDNAKTHVYLTTENNLCKDAYIRKSIERTAHKAPAMDSGRIQELIDKIIKSRNENIIPGEEGYTAPNSEQRAMVAHVLSNDNNIIIVQGLAGVGKTFSCDYLREACTREGIKIVGACFTGKAADGLQADSGIKSCTIHSFLNEIERKYQPHKAENYITNNKEQNNIKQEWDFSNVPKVTKREIILVDEAGLLDNNLMFQLLKYQEARGNNCQLVLQGDYDQLPALGAGTPMKSMIEQGASCCYMTDIRRQKNLELLEAVRQSVKGSTCITFKILNELGAYHEIKDRNKRWEAIADNAIEYNLKDYKHQLVIVSTNQERESINHLIRTRYIAKNELGKGFKFKLDTEEIKLDGTKRTKQIELAAGDRVIFKKNDKKLNVLNGSLGQIESVDKNGNLCIKLDTGESRQFNIASYSHIDYSYAVTNYASQGMSINRALCDMSSSGRRQSRNDLYVDISRAKYDVIVFTDDKEALERQTLKFAKKINSKDFLDKINSMQNGMKITNNDRYHAHDQAKINGLEAFAEAMSRPSKALNEAQNRIAERARQAEYFKNVQLQNTKLQTTQPAKNQTQGKRKLNQYIYFER